MMGYCMAMKNRAEATETGWRGSREGWLETGYQALIDGGIDAVKIQPLAKHLSLSRTSFYWFFEDREALLSALIDGWEERTTGPLIRAAQVVQTPEQQELGRVTPAASAAASTV